MSLQNFFVVVVVGKLTLSEARYKDIPYQT